ncbi:hypothetical protein PIB30_090680 [Stylosanthes scabra]|uniref:Uncharacterized protein n=1 Tax=Stylosanthes scabra TaxID=79078 RepID=A0ABU6VXI9_9FABA|nr:hypothetical protein [Stylosanthes scabra]
MTFGSGETILGIYPEQSSGAGSQPTHELMACTRIRHASYLFAHLIVYMGSGVIYYEYEKCDKLEDYDLKADAELGTFKIRRYHFDNESFIHPLHSVRFDPNRPYEVPIETLMADQPLSSSNKGRTSA